MTLITDEIDQFRSIFEASRGLIQGCEGCIDVKLMRDVTNTDQFFTLSTWKDEAALEAYRSSVLFRGTWQKVKPLFSQKAEAWSLTEQFSEVI